MPDGSLRYEVAFDVKGLGETAKVTRTIKDVEAAARSVRAQRITDLGLAAQAARAGEATQGVNGLSQALASVARVAGAGPLAEFGNNLANVAERSGQAGGALGSFLRIAGGLGVAVTGYRLITEQIDRHNEALDKAIDRTLQLGRAGNDAFARNRAGAQGLRTTEERDTFLADLEKQRTELTRKIADSTDPQEQGQLTKQRQLLDVQATQASRVDLKTQAQVDAFAASQTDAQRKRDLGAAFARDQAATQARNRFELSMADTPDTLGGAQKRRQLLLDRSENVYGDRMAAAERIRVAERTGTADDLADAQGDLAEALREQAQIARSLVAENKTIEDLTAKDEEARTKRREELNKALRERSADEARRFGGGGPEVDSFAQRGLTVAQPAGRALGEVRQAGERRSGFASPARDASAARALVVGPSPAATESIRWQQASAKALERLVGLTAKLVAKPTGKTTTTWED